jgi:hypothetical protein
MSFFEFLPTYEVLLIGTKSDLRDDQKALKQSREQGKTVPTQAEVS